MSKATKKQKSPVVTYSDLKPGDVVKPGDEFQAADSWHVTLEPMHGIKIAKGHKPFRRPDEK